MNGGCAILIGLDAGSARFGREQLTDEIG